MAFCVTALSTVNYKSLFTCFPDGGFPGGSVGKEPGCNAGDTGDVGLIPGWGRSLGMGNSNPLQYSCLENPRTEEPGELHGLRGPKGLATTERRSTDKLEELTLCFTMFAESGSRLALNRSSVNE